MDRSLQKKSFIGSAVYLQKNERITKVRAVGTAADYLTGIFVICIITLTINAITKS